MFQKITKTDLSKTTILIRIMIGAVFLSEGIQKFLFPAIRGAGRFEKIGLPSPEFLGSFVGTFEILCGILVLTGLFTRLASIPLITIMLVAIAATKSEVLAEKGFWEMMHGSRTDWAMLVGNIFLLIKGGGRWSIDSLVFNPDTLNQIDEVELRK
ncbi:DoxX family protein [Sphingobacterium alkalisoli]|uniref:DoxX family protein n=1 Tax=Sphingobacterium alkalisoli TaxID=1874115 RepID=A0A4V5LX78_9SPHI|nr:DoxX family protein [Sphingobacterium alkalisoli]TJY61509.1 DoxX family protein [Sphingobacterium alkalisoli]